MSYKGAEEGRVYTVGVLKIGCRMGRGYDIIWKEDYSLIEPIIIVLKKNYRILKLWADVLNSTGFMKGNSMFVIDDKADAAFLNTLINKGINIQLINIQYN